jgi:hypothetical protein
MAYEHGSNSKQLRIYGYLKWSLIWKLVIIYSFVYLCIGKKDCIVQFIVEFWKKTVQFSSVSVPNAHYQPECIS